MPADRSGRLGSRVQDSMTMLDDARAVRESRVLRFKGDTVHHCNYLSQPETCRHIRSAFKV